jgi:hypothetical protein
LHELAHIRRYDYLVNWGQAVLEVLFFYHPAIWWMSRQVRTEREHCCDDWVMRVHHEPMVYAQALTQLQLSHYSLKTNLVMSATKNQGSFTTRIHRLFGKYPSSTLNRKGAFVALLLLALCVGLTAYPSQATTEMDVPSIMTDTTPTKVIIVDDIEDLEIDKTISRHIDAVLNEDGNWEYNGNDSVNVIVLNEESEERSIIYHVKGRLNEDGNWEYNHLNSNGETSDVLEQSLVRKLTEKYNVKEADVRFIQKKGVVDTFISFNPIISEEVAKVMKELDGNVQKPTFFRIIKEDGMTHFEGMSEENTFHPTIDIQRDTIVTFDPETFEETVKVVTTYTEDDVELSVNVKEVKADEVQTDDSVINSIEVHIEGENDNLSNPERLHVVNGEILEEGSPGVFGNEIKEIRILRGDAGIEKYGEAGQNGVVEITTKENVKKPDPLFVINGEIVDIPLSDISPEDIKEIHVLKGDPAIKKYGEAGRNGVVEITMKKKNWKRKKKGEEEISLDFAVPPAPPSPPAPPAAPDAPPAAPDAPPAPSTPPTIDLEEALKETSIGKFDGSFKVYPNPANELVNIQLHTNSGSEVLVNIFNSVGQQVYARYMEEWQGKARFEWDTAGVPNGIYTAIVSIDGVKRSQQLVVEH